MLRRPLRPGLKSPTLSSFGKRRDEVSDRPPVTPIRQRERSVTEVTIRPSPPRLARDKILELMSDGCFHAAYELANLATISPGEWYIALQQLIEHGFTFARTGNKLLLNVERGAPPKTPAQDLQKLLSGIDATRPEVRGGQRSTGERSVVHTYGRSTSLEVNESSLDADVDALQDDDVLKLSEDPDAYLPAKVSVTSTRAILAKKSSGKTYLAMVIAEEYERLTALTGTPMPFVVIDPTGVWYGLSATPEGFPSASTVLRLGGRHGDWPLSFEQGARVAELVVELWPQSVVIDVSDMLPEEQHQFVADFGSKLYTINVKPVHVFIDEADEFSPQSTNSGDKIQRRCLGVVDRLVRRARVKGVGCTLITQRPAVISKNVLSQVDGIFVLHLDAPHDLEAVESWLKPSVCQADRALCLEALPTLQRGDVFFVQSHKKSGALIKFTTRKKLTFDSSRTPTVDDPEPPTPSLSKVDVEIWKRAGAILGHKQEEIEASSPVPVFVSNEQREEEDGLSYLDPSEMSDADESILAETTADSNDEDTD